MYDWWGLSPLYYIMSVCYTSYILYTNPEGRPSPSKVVISHPSGDKTSHFSSELIGGEQLPIIGFNLYTIEGFRNIFSFIVYI